MVWGTPKEIEKKKRINIALWAYAYEVRNSSIVNDFVFDEAAYKIDLKQSTGNKNLDNWFKKNFDPCTGSWVWNHPGINQLEWIFNKYFIHLEGL